MLICVRIPSRSYAMSASAPITQDVLTIPRKLPEGGKTNLVGLTRDAMRAALIAKIFDVDQQIRELASQTR